VPPTGASYWIDDDANAARPFRRSNNVEVLAR
jgi:hypothetical protein